MRILLLMPDFFDYPKIITEHLTTIGHSVEYICNETKKYYLGFYYPKNIIRRIVRKIFPKYIKKKDSIRGEQIAAQHFEPFLKNLKGNFDVILCIRGSLFPESLYQYLHTQYQKALYIMYQWDDLNLLEKQTHLKWFSTIYSYNINDCKKYDFKYLPMFSKTPEIITPTEKKYDIAIVFTIDNDHKERLSLIEKIYNKYKHIYKFFIYLYQNDNITTELSAYKQKLSATEYIKILQQSHCVLDIAYVKQNGPTTRFNDAIAAKAKVITTNQNIKQYPIYSENILIIDSTNPEIDKQFVKTPYNNNNIEYMTIDKWCNTILNN